MQKTTWQEKADLLAQGYSPMEIAKILGVSRQAVYGALAQRRLNYFRKFDDTRCVYRNLRKWLNDNKVATAEIVRRMGYRMSSSQSTKFAHYLSGVTQPPFSWVIKLAKITGMPIEKMFAELFEEGHE